MVLTAALLVSRPLFLIHVMPWFVLDEQTVGWHWKMNKPDASVRAGQIASHFRPLVGAYDSNDPAILELQTGWMKLSGFDGVLADWYGIGNHFDYPAIHVRTLSLFAAAERAGLKIGIVYEDQSIGNAIREKKLLPSDQASEAERVGRFLGGDWLKRASWLRLGTAPTVFVFGPQAFGEADWQAFRRGTGPIDLFTLHEARPGSQGVYDWPIPNLGLDFNSKFPARSPSAKLRVPVVFPRFRDYYLEGGQKGYPVLADDDGRTMQRTMDEALALKPLAIQIATWNDWQEGTQVEPSNEFGYRDLLVVQRARRKVDPSFAFQPADLDLPLRLFKLRQAKKQSESSQKAALDRVSLAIATGKVVEAKSLLRKLEAEKLPTLSSRRSR